MRGFPVLVATRHQGCNALIRGRFGYFAIGLGEVGIRYRRGGAEDTQLVRKPRAAFVSIAKVL